MNDVTKYIIFWIVFLSSFFVTFKTLQAIELERIFKKYRIFEINAAYLIITILTSYLLGKFILDIIELFPGN